jgi:hypothetical protein
MVAPATVHLWIFEFWFQIEEPWAFGTTIHSYDGVFWRIAAAVKWGYLSSAWGATANDVWAVGYAPEHGDAVVPLIGHYNGTSWDVDTFQDERPHGASFDGIWGADGSDVYIVGNRDQTPGVALGNRYVIYHYTGKTWQRARVGLKYQFLYDVWVASTGEVFAVGYFDDPIEPTNWTVHFDGQTWSEGPVVDGSWLFFDVWGTSAHDVYSIGQSGETYRLFHFDGVDWSAQEVTVPGTRKLLARIPHFEV